LIITAGGENVAPVLIEAEIKEELKFLSNCMIIGDQRKYLTAVLTIKHEADKDGNIVNKLSPEAIAMLEALGSKAKTAEEARKCPIILKVI